MLLPHAAARILPLSPMASITCPLGGCQLFTHDVPCKKATSGVGLPETPNAEGLAVLTILAQAPPSLVHQLDAYGIAAVLAVVLTGGGGFVFWLVQALLRVTGKTTEVVENNNAALRELKQQGTEHIHEFQRMNDNLNQRPCIKP